MAKKYLNCPTCGGIAFYPSKNWENVDIKISAMTASEIEKELRFALERIQHLENLLDCNTKNDLLNELDTEELWRAYIEKRTGHSVLTWTDLFRKED